MEEEEEARDVPAFSIETNKAVATGVGGASWCPSMDLVAVTNAAGNAVTIHRMTWQQTASVSVSAVSCCWRPDGKLLALGTDKGPTIVRVESGTHLVDPGQEPYAAILSLSWTDAAPKTSPPRTTESLIRPCAMLTAEPSDDAAGKQAGPLAPPPLDPDFEDMCAGQGFTVLTAAGAEGSLELLALGAVRVGRTDSPLASTSGRAEAPQLSARHDAQLSADLGRLVSVRSTARGSDVAVFSTAALQALSSQAHAAAAHTLALRAALAATQGALRTVSQAWQAPRKMLHAACKSIRGSFDPGDPFSETADVLRQALVGGVPEATFREWLESDAGGVTIRQLARVVTGALETMHTAVMTSLAWQVRNLAVLLPDLGALGEAWRGDAARAAGVDLWETRALCRALHARAAALEARLADLLLGFTALFSWLWQLAYRLGAIHVTEEVDVSTFEVDAQLLVDFLRPRGLFCEPGIEHDLEGAGKPCRHHGAAPDALLAACGVTGSGSKLTSAGLHELLDSALDLLARMEATWVLPVTLEASMFIPTGELDLQGSPVPSSLLVPHSPAHASHGIDAPLFAQECLPLALGVPGIVVMDLAARTGTLLLLPQSTRLASMAWYRGPSLAVLLEARDGGSLLALVALSRDDWVPVGPEQGEDAADACISQGALLPWEALGSRELRLDLEGPGLMLSVGMQRGLCLVSGSGNRVLVIDLESQGMGPGSDADMDGSGMDASEGD